MNLRCAISKFIDNDHFMTNPKIYRYRSLNVLSKNMYAKYEVLII